MVEQIKIYVTKIHLTKKLILKFAEWKKQKLRKILRINDGKTYTNELHLSTKKDISATDRPNTPVRILWSKKHTTQREWKWESCTRNVKVREGWESKKKVEIIVAIRAHALTHTACVFRNQCCLVRKCLDVLPTSLLP